MKKTVLTIAIALAAFASNAQLNSSAYAPAHASVVDNVQVQVPNKLEMSPAHSTTILSTTTLPATVTNNQTFTVKSNKEFSVFVNINSHNNLFFDYDRGNSANHIDFDDNVSMPLSDLKMKVATNLPGGTIMNGFTSYTPLVHTWFNWGLGAQLIDEAQPGGNQQFDVAYKVDLGWNHVGGIYSATVVYTAVQE